MLTKLLSAAAGVGLSLAAIGQTVEFRFVERTGKQLVTSSDPLLELAVQARVNGGASLGKFSFTIAILNEPTTGGTLQKAKISLGGRPNFYLAGGPWIANSAIGIGGIAGQFTYLGNTQNELNGLINSSGLGFTHNPSQQEIGLIKGYAAGQPLLYAPWIDTDEDGIPDLAVSNGGTSGTGETCPLDSRAAGPYFASGQFIDVYRFRYTVTDSSPRLLTISLRDQSADTFTHLVYLITSWVGDTAPVASNDVTSTPLLIQVDSGTGPQGACCAPTGACTIVNQIVCPGGSGWTQGQPCSPILCPHPGTCCDGAGTCAFEFQSACTPGAWWTVDGTCAPNPCVQPGRCCASSGACSIIISNGCSGIWEPTGACSTNSCPGACCHMTSCTLTDQTTCQGSLAGTFMGMGVPCGVPGNPLGCCPVNFDAQGGVNVADIFAFLNAWFAGDPRADFQRNNVLDVFDVFGFVGAWFQGCQ